MIIEKISGGLYPNQCSKSYIMKKILAKFLHGAKTNLINECLEMPWYTARRMTFFRSFFHNDIAFNP